MERNLLRGVVEGSHHSAAERWWLVWVRMLEAIWKPFLCIVIFSFDSYAPLIPPFSLALPRRTARSLVSCSPTAKSRCRNLADTYSHVNASRAILLARHAQ